MADLMSRTDELQERAALNDPAFYARDLDEVHKTFTRMRREEPVFWHERGKFWVLSKYEDQRHVMRHPEIFGNRYGFFVADSFDPKGVAGQLPEWAQEKLAAGGLSAPETRALIARAKISMGYPEARFLNVMDPPDHSDYRNVLTAAFSQRLVRGLGPLVHQITVDALADIEMGSTRDLVKDVAERIPVTLTADLMNIPHAKRADFLRYSNAFMEALDVDPETDPEEARRIGETFTELLAYLEELLAERREHPGDDLVSRIVTADLQGSPVNHIDGVTFFVALMAGGNHTTMLLLSHIAQALAERPDQRQLLIDRPELIPNAVEEVLRFYPISWVLCRTALERTEIRGQTIEKGDYLACPLPSANRDEDVWDRPHEFDVTRNFDVDHQAFGSGNHFCVGSSMARMEGRIFIEEMLARFPRWEIADEPVRFTSMHLNGLDHMQVRFQ